MLTANLRTTAGDERGSGRLTPPDFFYPDPDDKSTAICFIWEGRDRPNFYNVQLQRRYGGRWLLGAIEYNERLECWYITHIEREPLNRAEGLPYLSYSDATQYLHENWLANRKAQLKAVEA